MEKITDPFTGPKLAMDTFVPCPEVHPGSGRQCESQRGHIQRGMPHVYTMFTPDLGMAPVWWDERGDIVLPEFVICPVKKCLHVEMVHVMVPDMAVLNMMGHFLDEHREHDSLTLLDEMWWNE